MFQRNTLPAVDYEPLPDGLPLLPTQSNGLPALTPAVGRPCPLTWPQLLELGSSRASYPEGRMSACLSATAKAASYLLETSAYFL